MSPLVLAFLVLALLTCGSALSMLWTKNLLHAALAMFLTMLGLAGLYVLAYADVLAVAHLLVYVGGVLILILFGIMLTNQTDPSTGKNHLMTRESGRLLPISVGLSFFLGLFWLFTKGPWIHSLPVTGESKLREVGLGLLTEYAFPFEYLKQCVFVKAPPLLMLPVIVY